MFGEIFADDGEFERPVGVAVVVGDAQKVGIAGVGIRRRHFGHLDPVGPLDFERRRREKQRSGKTALRADAGLGDRLFAGEARDALGKLGRRHAFLISRIDRAGDGRAQAFGRKARDAADAGDAAGELRPIVGCADAE